MIWLDWLILSVVVLAMIQGAWMGAVKRIIQLLAIVVGLTECWRIAPWIRDNVISYLDVGEDFAKLLALALSFTALYLLIYWGGSWLTSMIKGGVTSFVNRVLGAVLGLVISVYAMGYLFTLIDRFGPTEDTLVKYELSDVRRRSQFYAPVKASVVDLENLSTYLSL